MRLSDESVHGTGERETGRTRRQLASLLPGDVFVVHSVDMMKYARRMLADLDIPRVSIVVLTSPQDYSRPHQQLRALPKTAWIEVDHWTRPKLSDAMVRWIEVHNHWVSKCSVQ